MRERMLAQCGRDGDRLRGRGWRGPDRGDAPGWDDARSRVGPENGRLHPAPELVLVLLAPDPAHLGQRVTLDHWLILPRRGDQPGRPPGAAPRVAQGGRLPWPPSPGCAQARGPAR